MKNLLDLEICPKQLNWGELASLYGRCGWGSESEYNLQQLQSAHEATVFAIAVFNQQRQLVGYARVFSDNFTYITWVAEILVAPEYRRQGVGTAIMNQILLKAHHTAIYAEIFSGTEHFFNKFGITAKQKLVACSRRNTETWRPI